MTEPHSGAEVFFLLMGAILVFAMHGGFAFLEAGTVRHKNQVNALVKILVDFAISTTVYFLFGYWLAYGIHLYASAPDTHRWSRGLRAAGSHPGQVLLPRTFAAAVPAIISGGIAERARFWPQCIATAALVGIAYPLVEGTVWNKNFGLQSVLFAGFSAPSSRILPARSSSTRSAAGRRWRQSCGLARAAAATPRAARSRPRRRRCRGWRWARGCCASAGSASTS